MSMAGWWIAWTALNAGWLVGFVILEGYAGNYPVDVGSARCSIAPTGRRGAGAP